MVPLNTYYGGFAGPKVAGVAAYGGVSSVTSSEQGPPGLPLADNVGCPENIGSYRHISQSLSLLRNAHGYGSRHAAQQKRVYFDDAWNGPQKGAL